MRTRLMAVVSTLLLSACIPRGGDDYRLGQVPVAPTEVISTPQIVPEQAIVAETPSWSPASV